MTTTNLGAEIAVEETNNFIENFTLYFVTW